MFTPKFSILDKISSSLRSLKYALETFWFNLKLIIVKFCTKQTYGVTCDGSFRMSKDALEKITTVDTDYYIGDFEKKGRVKLSHTFVITKVNPMNDTVTGYIEYCDSLETTSDITLPIYFIDAFFKKKKI